MGVTQRTPKRELHFILVCDISGSMRIEGRIQGLNQAIRETIPEIQSAVKEKPNAQVLIRVLRFSDEATWCAKQPTPLEQFQLDQDLSAEGLTYLNKAFDKLAEALSHPRLPSHMLPPVIVLISDGQPCEPWEKSLEALIATTWGGKAVRLAVAVGEDADRNLMRRFVGDPKINVFEVRYSGEIVEKVKQASLQGIAAASERHQEGLDGDAALGTVDPFIHD